MNAKEYLKGIKKDITKIDLLECEIARLKAERDGVTTRGEFIPGKHGYHVIDMSDVLAKIDHYIETDNALHASLIDRRKHAQDMIFEMDNETHSRILYSYYILGISFEQLAYTMHLSYWRIIHLHGEALSKLASNSIK